MCQNLAERNISINHHDLINIFDLYVDISYSQFVAVPLCKDHSLMYFKYKRFRCVACNRVFHKGIYRKRIPDSIFEFVKS